jgi:DNA-binding GntR family transcriptional regulator
MRLPEALERRRSAGTDRAHHRYARSVVPHVARKMEQSLSGQAIYLDIAAYVRGLVASLQPGDLLPSDAELCERFNVSRMTARQAVQLLVNEHLVERRRGRGTFVAKRRVPRSLGSPLSFTESMAERGLRATSSLIESRDAKATGEDAAALRLSEGDPVRIIERVRLADDVPMAIERAVIPLSVAEAIGGKTENGSLHRAFISAGHSPSKAEAEVTARLSTDYEQEHLDLEPAAVVLSETRTIYDQDDVPLEHTTTVYVADRYSFTAVLFPHDSAQGPR